VHRVLGAFGVAILLVASATELSVANQPDRSRTETLADRAATRLKALHLEADRLAAEARTLLGDLRKLELERQIRVEEFRHASSQAAAAGAKLASLDEEVQRLEGERQSSEPELQRRLVDLYKLGRGSYARLLLSTTEIRQVGQASRMVGALAKRDRERINAYQEKLAQLTASRRALEERSRELAKLRAEAERTQAAAERALAARNALVQDVDRRRDLNAQLTGELQTAQQNLQRALAASGGAATEPASLPLKPFAGDLDWPAAGAVRTPFAVSGADGSRTVTGAGLPIRRSDGIEIAAAEGAPVRAIHDGTVAFADAFEGFGRLVIVNHGGQTYSVYGHLLDIRVARGDRVDRGQTLGAAGATPLGAPGLYFELRIDGRRVDPLQWLKKQ
jgi:septal ring factor EnvC (AmiA/AmiB activator)